MKLHKVADLLEKFEKSEFIAMLFGYACANNIRRSANQCAITCAGEMGGNKKYRFRQNLNSGMMWNMRWRKMEMREY